MHKVPHNLPHRPSHNAARRAFLSTVALLIAAACSGKSDNKADTASPASATALRVGLLTPGPITDHAWNGGAYDALVTLRDSLGAKISNIQTATPAEFDENFRQYGVQGYQLVFGHGFEYQDAAIRIAPAYPKTVYIVTSGRTVAPNVAGVDFSFEEASYQAGMLAGTLTKSNVIGLIAGTEFPPVKASFDAFVMGAKSMNPAVKTITSYIGNWEDVSAAKEQALAQIGRGADIIFQNADAAGLGIFQAAKEKHILAIGSNQNQNALAPDIIPASVVIDLNRAFLTIAREVQGGTFKGRVIKFGVRDTVVRLEINSAFNDRISPKTRAAIDSVGRALADGSFRGLEKLITRGDTAK